MFTEPSLKDTVWGTKKKKIVLALKEPIVWERETTSAQNSTQSSVVTTSERCPGAAGEGTGKAS